MPEVLSPSDAVPANVQHPLDTEAATASGLKALFSQPVTNWLNFLDRRLRLLGTTETRTDADDIDEFSSITIPAQALLGAGNVFLELAKKLGNRTKYLRKGIPGVATSYTTLQSIAAVGNTNSRWEFFTSGLYWRQSDITSVGALVFPLAVPSVGKLTSVSVRIEGGASGNRPGALPGTMPTLSVYRMTMASGASVFTGPTLLGSTVTDTSADLTAYCAAHDLTVGSLNETITNDSRYFAWLTGEAAANATANELRFNQLWTVVSP